jgi:hypothetical protein
LPYQKYWSGLAYGQDFFVSVGSGQSSTYAFPYSNQAVAITPDPHDWSGSTMDQPGVWIDVAYGNGQFVAITANSAAIATSTYQGRSWVTNSNALPVAQTWTAVNYGNGQFVAIAHNSNTAAVSTDGITWTAATLPVAQAWTDLAYGKNQWVAVAANSNTAAVSTDGITWTASVMPATQTWTAITFGQDRFVAVSSNTAISAVLV